MQVIIGTEVIDRTPGPPHPGRNLLVAIKSRPPVEEVCGEKRPE
jgi:hypothetical protein